MAAEQSSARWQFYFRALAGDYSGWDAADAPFPGFYRYRYSLHHPYQPCALWDSAEGKIVAVRGTMQVPCSPLLLWVVFNVWTQPVLEEQYRYAVQHDARWWDSLEGATETEHAGRVVADVRHARPIQPRRR